MCMLKILSRLFVLAAITLALSHQTDFLDLVDSQYLLPATKAVEEDLCGKFNFFFVGLPPGHPITNGTVDPWFIYNDIRRGAKAYRDAGYNTKVLLFGPETDLGILEEQLAGTKWDATGVGYGIRGSGRDDLTNRLEDIVQIYRKEATHAPILFNAGPADFLGLQKYIPISKNCIGKPGKDLGFQTICNICSI